MLDYGTPLPAILHLDGRRSWIPGPDRLCFAFGFKPRCFRLSNFSIDTLHKFDRIGKKTVGLRKPGSGARRGAGRQPQKARASAVKARESTTGVYRLSVFRMALSASSRKERALVLIQ